MGIQKLLCYAEEVQTPVKGKTEPVIKENGNGTIPTAGRLVFLVIILIAGQFIWQWCALFGIFSHNRPTTPTLDDMEAALE